jgi:competence protein ComEC
VDTNQIIRGGDNLASSGLVLVQTSSLTHFQYGDRVRSTGFLSTPAEYDTFSYAEYLARSGIFSIMKNAIVEVEATGQGSPFYRALFKLREQASQMIATYLPEPQAGLLTGILLGNQRGISSELQDAFNATGTSHIIAISGFNMAIISALITGAFKRIFRRRWLAGFAAIAVIVIYTLFVGANASVVRAAIMCSLLIVADLLRRKTYLPASLAFVVILMSALNPTVLWDLSFQLSFFATLGLMLFADPLTKGFDALLNQLFAAPVAARVSGLLTEPLIVTIAALVFTLPLTILYFNRFSLITLPVNLLVIPVQSALLLLGGAAVLLSFVIPALAQVLYWFCMVLLSWTIEVIRTATRLPFASVDFSIDPRLVAVFFVLTIGWAMMQAAQPGWWLAIVRLIRRQATLSTALASGAITALLVVGVAVSRPDGQLHVWFLDVGHSNAVLLQTPDGAQILIDGGRFPSRLLTSIGDRLPFNDREIELLVITTPDEFQFGALPAVLSRYSTGAVLMNGQPNQGESFAELQTALAGRQVVNITAGYSAEFNDGVRIEMLNPQHTPELGDEMGDGALVLRVTYSEVSFLLTGQLSTDGQEAMLDEGQYPLATVLQLPRQGTIRSLSADFLAAVQPSLVIVQADKANTRGDPDPDVLSLLPYNVPVYRTDQHGVIHLWTNGHELWELSDRTS